MTTPTGRPPLSQRLFSLTMTTVVFPCLILGLAGGARGVEGGLLMMWGSAACRGSPSDAR